MKFKKNANLKNKNSFFKKIEIKNNQKINKFINNLHKN